MNYGRKEIFTDVMEVNIDNILDVLQKAEVIHRENARDITELISFDKNNIPKYGIKITRKDIDFWVPISLSSIITKFWQSYDWGNPITLVQRGENYSGTDSEPSGIALLNKCYEAQFIRKKSQELGRYVTVAGVGNTLVEINSEWKEGESPFTIDTLDPRYSFIVRSMAYPDRRKVLGVTFRENSDGDTFYTCYTPKSRFLIDAVNGEINIKEEKNPLGLIPITEYFRDFDRMGCFERQIPEIKAISRMISDTINQQNQNTNALWHGNDIEFGKDEYGNEKRPKSGEWVLTQTTRDGKQPFLKPITMDYNYQGTLEEIINLINLVLIEANVPQRNDNSGGSTGVAMADATGWTHAENEASRHDQIKMDCKSEEVKAVLAAIKATAIATVPDELRKLIWIDCKANIKRQKNYEMVTKINTYATGVSHGISPKHMINTINLFDDPQQTVNDSEPYIERYLASAFNENNNLEPDRLQSDVSDQITNSPNVDGMSTGQEVE